MSRLVLHFDINSTILIADPAVGTGVVCAVNTYVAGIVWGRKAPDSGAWEWSPQTLAGEASLTAPSSEFSVSYYKYLEAKMADEGLARAEFRLAIGRVSESPEGGVAAPLVAEILRSLEVPEDEAQTPWAFQEDGTWYHYVIPSFWRLLAWLREEDRDFRVCLRTFGTDGPRVAQVVDAFARGEHSAYPEGCPRVQLAEKAEFVLRRGTGGSMELVGADVAQGREEEAGSSEGGEVLRDECAIHDFFDRLEGTVAVRDDYAYWKLEGFGAPGGKPLWIPGAGDPEGSQHILFDDNIRLDEPGNSIADVRISAATDETEKVVTSWSSCDPCLGADKGCLVQAALHESATNSQYFILKLQECERLWAQRGTT